MDMLSLQICMINAHQSQNVSLPKTVFGRCPVRRPGHP